MGQTLSQGSGRPPRRTGFRCGMAGGRSVVSPARLAAMVLIVVVMTACANRRPVRRTLGIPPCLPGASARLLEPPALECWFTAAHGRWRLMTQASHLEALVVEVAADDLRDADEIARLFVAGERHRFSEIIVYAHREPMTTASRVRRVRWTMATGYDAMEFSWRSSTTRTRSGIRIAGSRRGSRSRTGARRVPGRRRRATARPSRSRVKSVVNRSDGAEHEAAAFSACARFTSGDAVRPG